MHCPKLQEVFRKLRPRKFKFGLLRLKLGLTADTVQSNGAEDIAAAADLSEKREESKKSGDNNDAKASVKKLENDVRGINDSSSQVDLMSPVLDSSIPSTKMPTSMEMEKSNDSSSSRIMSLGIKIPSMTASKQLFSWNGIDEFRTPGKDSLEIFDMILPPAETGILKCSPLHYPREPEFFFKENRGHSSTGNDRKIAIFRHPEKSTEIIMEVGFYAESDDVNPNGMETDLPEDPTEDKEEKLIPLLDALRHRPISEFIV